MALSMVENVSLPWGFPTGIRVPDDDLWLTPLKPDPQYQAEYTAPQKRPYQYKTLLNNLAKSFSNSSHPSNFHFPNYLIANSSPYLFSNLPSNSSLIKEEVL